MVGGSGMRCPTSVLSSIECFLFIFFDTKGKEVLFTQTVSTCLFVCYCHVTSAGIGSNLSHRR